MSVNTTSGGIVIKQHRKRSQTVDDEYSHIEERARDLVRMLFRRSLTSQQFCNSLKH